MKVRLTVKHKKANVKTVVLHSDALIGRSTECNLRLASGQISRKHCRLLINDERVAIEDLGSSNGTYLNEQKLESNSITTLSTGDLLSIGAVSFLIEYKDPSDETQIRKKSTKDAGDVPVKATEAEDVDITPAAGTPVFAKSSKETSEPTSSEDDDIDVDELSDGELEALLAEEDIEDDEEQSSIELESDDETPDAQINDAEETVRISAMDNPVIQEEFASPSEDEEKEDGDDDDEEDVMNFLQDLE